jgi:hypothetical protein
MSLALLLMESTMSSRQQFPTSSLCRQRIELPAYPQPEPDLLLSLLRAPRFLEQSGMLERLRISLWLSNFHYLIKSHETNSDPRSPS